MLLTPELIKIRLKRLGIQADKYLGQHFLVDEAVLGVIINEAKQFVQSKDTILEIGPGLGVLTGALTENFDNKIVAVERDPVLADVLKEFAGNPDNLEVIKNDVLDEAPRVFPSEPWCVVANIPYAITSPLLRKLLHRTNPPHAVLILVQKELAERITAEPGNSDRGLLTVQVELMAETNIIQTVPKTAFWPQPEVESALLLLKTRPTPFVELEKMKDVLRIATIGFAAKRKQLLNNMAGGHGKTSAEIRPIMEKAGIDPTRRAETLTLEEWVKLSEVL